jgi:hypothetical protein
MATFYTDSGSFNSLTVSGSTTLSASRGIALQIRSSGSTIFSVSGSGGEIFNISDAGSSTSLFTVASSSITILNIDNTKAVSISGSLIITGSAYIRGLETTAQTSVVTIDTSTGQLYTTASSAVGGGGRSAPLSYIVTGSVTASVNIGSGNIFTVTSESVQLFNIKGGSNSGSISIDEKGINFSSSFNPSQIRIGTLGNPAGGASTQGQLLAIGDNAAASLQSTGGGSLTAIGRSAGISITTGGTYSTIIGRGAGNGITTAGDGVTILSNGDYTDMPNINTALILLGGRGFQANQAARTMGTGVIGTGGFAIIGGGYGASSYIKDYYFGGGPFVTDPTESHITFYATSATGSNMSASNFTFNAGRGRGTGTPGDIYFGTSTTGSSGDTLQTLSTRMTIKGNTGNVGIGTSEPTGALHVAIGGGTEFQVQSTGIKMGNSGSDAHSMTGSFGVQVAPVSSFLPGGIRVSAGVDSVDYATNFTVGNYNIIGRRNNELHFGASNAGVYFVGNQMYIGGTLSPTLIFGTSTGPNNVSYMSIGPNTGSEYSNSNYPSGSNNYFQISTFLSSANPVTNERRPLYIGGRDIRIFTGGILASESFNRTPEMIISASGEVTINTVLTLPYQNPLPSGKPIGSIATSGSGATFVGLFLYNGTSWVKLSV